MNVYLIPPSPLDLYENGTPKLTCLVVDLESEKDVVVTWTQEHKKSHKTGSASSQKSTRHRNATTSITSTLPVETKDWIEGVGYRCTVDHPVFPRPLVRSITRAPGEHRGRRVGQPFSMLREPG